MIRSELCKIARIEPATFNSHRRNGDLPFNISDYEAKDGQGRVWARFDAFAAARIIAAKDLCAQGVSWSNAARILREPNMSTGGNVAIHTPGIFIGRALYALDSETARRSFGKEEMIWQGPLSAITDCATRYADAVSRNHPREVINLRSLIAVDLSGAYRLALLRAEQEGIDLSADGAPNSSQD